MIIRIDSRETIDDERNTDHSWVKTKFVCLHDERLQAMRAAVRLQVDDDGLQIRLDAFLTIPVTPVSKTLRASWVPIHRHLKLPDIQMVHLLSFVATMGCYH